jgi:hypothetical protein
MDYFFFFFVLCLIQVSRPSLAVELLIYPMPDNAGNATNDDEGDEA